RLPSKSDSGNGIGMIVRRAVLSALVATLGAASMILGRPLANAQGPERIGLEGYDPVAYFTLSAPTPGFAEYEYVYDGVRYRFANARHLALFKTNPDKYAPQFGGLCANNMSNGDAARVRPDRLDYLALLVQGLPVVKQ